MKSLFTKYKWMQLVYGTLMLIAGVMVVVFAIQDKANITKWLSIVVSITLFAYALALVITGIFTLQQRKRVFDPAFIYASIFIAVGVLLLVKYLVIGEFITIFVATLLVCLGGVSLINGGLLIFYKKKIRWMVLFFSLAAVSLTLGILAFVFKDDAQQYIYIGLGIVMAIVGIIQIIIGTAILREENKKEKAAKKTNTKKKAIRAKVDDPAPTKEQKQDETKAITTTTIVDADVKDPE